MIKVNLLDSVTDRARGVAVVEQKVTNPAMQTLMMGVVVLVLLMAGIGYDYVSAGAAKAKAQKDLEEQQRIAAQMAAINKEQAEMEKKIKDIQSRIEAIKVLRSSQQGPVALLSAMNERLPGAPDFRLESVEQKGGELTIEGHSPNEAAVTQFARSLEFSSGLFTNVSIETEKKDMEVSAADYDARDGVPDLTFKPETMKFKIRCRYMPAPAPGSQQPAGNQPAPTQVAQK